MKKGIVGVSVLIIAAAVIFFVLSGEKEKVTINILVPGEHYSELRSVVTDYEEKNNVKINIMKDFFFGDIDKLANLINNGQEDSKTVPDIFYSISDWNENIINFGIAQEIEGRNLREVTDFTKKSVEYNGKYYGYPFYWEMQAFFYNKKYVEKVPQSMGEILALGKKIETENKDIYGFMIPIGSYFTFPIHTLFGGSEITVKNVTSPEAKEIFIKEIEFIRSSLLHPSGYDMEMNMFLAGKLAMVVEGTWNLEKLKSVDFEYGISVLPDEKMKPFIGVKSFIISSKSKKKNEAEKFVKYLCSYETQKKLMKNGTFIPVNRKLFEENIDKDYIKAMSDSAKKGVLIPPLKLMEGYWIKKEMLLKEAEIEGKDISKSVDIILRK